MCHQLQHDKYKWKRKYTFHVTGINKITCRNREVYSHDSEVSLKYLYDKALPSNLTFFHPHDSNDNVHSKFTNSFHKKILSKQKSKVKRIM